MELRVRISDELVNELKYILGRTKAVDVAMDALTLLKWAADEKRQKRIILSADQKGSNVHRLVMEGVTIPIKCDKCNLTL